MAATPSVMTELGSKAASFSLDNLNPLYAGKQVSLADFNGKPLMLAFICNHCPYVLRIEKALSQVFNEFQDKGFGCVVINSNDVSKYPDDSPDKMTAFAKRNGFHFPYLFDESQTVAKAYQAACTPDFYLFNENHELVYRGQFDDARPGNQYQPDGKDLRQAAEALLRGDKPNAEQKASIGCNIKWKPDNAPDYF